MILVNNPGDWSAVFPPLMHTYWTRCTLADLIFPWFIFIMGAAMPFAFARRHQCGQDTVEFHRRIIRRAALLLVLGLLLNWLDVWPASAPLRYPGVLQRIAVSYLLAAVVVMNFDQRVRALAAALLLGGHWALLTLVPFGGHPGGTLNPEHNLAGYVDATILGRHALARPIDPEGLLGILPSAATAIIGVLAGDLVRRTLHRQALVRRLAIAGAGTLSVGLVWSLMLPVSKPLWTRSYVLIVTGLGMLASMASTSSSTLGSYDLGRGRSSGSASIRSRSCRVRKFGLRRIKRPLHFSEAPCSYRSCTSRCPAFCS
jgi:predicted acyltransferase